MTETTVAVDSRYAKWEGKLQGRNHMQRKIANNTWLIRATDSIHIKYHATVIAKIYPEGKIVLDSGGWRTSTTKLRFNNLFRGLGLPLSIYQKDGIWFILGKTNTGDEAKAWTFADGMWVLPDGTVAGVGPDPSHLAKCVKLIRDYTKPVGKMIADGKFPRPGAGDPWNFLLASQEEGTLPLAGPDSETRKYLLEYMKQKYYFGSLLLRAMEWKLGVKHGNRDALQEALGTRNNGVSPVCKQVFVEWINGDVKETPNQLSINQLVSFAADQLEKILRDYIKYWFKLAA